MDARRGFRFGLGPVFAFEQVACSRRWQWYASRSVFVGMLLAALVVVAVERPGPGSPRELAELGATFYVAVVGTQIVLVLLAAPAATAGAICQDRASGMMTHVLVTDLSDAEVVLGKLAARLVPVLVQVAAALPLLALLTLLGGMDPQALLGAFVVTVGVAVLGCSLAFAFSLWARRTHEALLGTYAVLGIWLLTRPFAGLLSRGFGSRFEPPGWLADPFLLAFGPYWSPGSVSPRDYAAFLAAMLAISAGLVLLAIFRLRAACTRTPAPRPSQPRRFRLARLVGRIDPTRYLPGVSLDSNPVLWREWRRSRPSRLGMLVGVVFAAGASVASLGAVLSGEAGTMAWTNALQVSIGMLLLAVISATSLAEERVRGTLDVLMTTTLTTREIVAGKWLGAFRLAPMLAILPTLVAVFGGSGTLQSRLIVLATLSFVLVCGAAVTGLGLLAATVIERPGRAVAVTVSIYLLVTVGWLCAAGFLRGPNMSGPLMASPFYFAGQLAADLRDGPRSQGDLAWATWWLLVYLAAAIAFPLATLAVFDRRLGRIELGGVWDLLFEERPAASQIS